jgi:hypothetical protein
MDSNQQQFNEAKWSELITEFARETDRAGVILGAARIDELLYELLAAFLLPSPNSNDDLLDTERPLGTFSARISMCYRLGLIDASFTRSLHLIRRIRNGFAHETAGGTLDSGVHRDRVNVLASPFRSDSAFTSLREILAEWFQEQKSQVALDFYTIMAIAIARLQWAAAAFPRIKSIEPMSLTAITFSRSKKQSNPKRLDDNLGEHHSKSEQG